MNPSTADVERQRVLEVAREYEANGYLVLVEPAPTQLPAFLSNFRPDMVAYGDRENVVIEVRSRATIGTADAELVGLAEAVDRQNDWRFELVIANPRTLKGPASDGVELSQREIENRLEMARELVFTEQEDAGVMLLWSVSEAALRATARRQEIDLDGCQPGLMIKQLYSLGVLARDEYEQLQGLEHARHLIAHGYRNPEHDSSWAKEMLRTVNNLVQRLARGDLTRGTNHD